MLQNLLGKSRPNILCNEFSETRFFKIRSFEDRERCTQEKEFILSSLFRQPENLKTSCLKITTIHFCFHNLQSIAVMLRHL